MSKRGITVLLGLIVLIAAFTLIQDFRFDARLSRERAAAAAVDRDLEGIGRSLSDVLTAQAGYVATGQAPGAWMTRATEAFDRLTTAVDARQKAALGSDARAKYDAIGQTIASLGSIDSKARSSIAQDDRLHAADLIYIDAKQTAEAAVAELAAVRVLEEQAAAGRHSRWAMLRLAMNGLALVLIACMAIYFGRALSILRDTPPASTAQMFRDLPPPVKGASSSISASGAGPATAHAAIAPAPAGSRPVPLAAAAELCVDLARILDGRDVQALLERTASVLEAKGIMIWSIDTGGAILRPSMCWGFSDKVMARVRPLQVDGDNVTSLAFRSMQPQLLPGASATDAAAIAVPLITSTGCVGVLAAEVKHGRPHPDLLLLARIVAAQFSTLVAPVDNAPQASAQG